MQQPVKVSVCPKCSNWVRVAIPDHLEKNTKARNEFKNEVFKYNLQVHEMDLSEFKDKDWSICQC